jgi:PAS domain-containing protein
MANLVTGQQKSFTLSHLAAVVESTDDAICSMTLDGVILTWNQAAEHRYGYTAAEAELQRLNADLEERVVQRTHDLRAPLITIAGFAEMLLEDREGELGEEARRRVRLIVENTRRSAAPRRPRVGGRRGREGATFFFTLRRPEPRVSDDG